MKVLDENGLSCLKSIIKPKVFEKKKTATSRFGWSGLSDFGVILRKKFMDKYLNELSTKTLISVIAG